MNLLLVDNSPVTSNVEGEKKQRNISLEIEVQYHENKIPVQSEWVGGAPRGTLPSSNPESPRKQLRYLQFSV